MFFSSSVMYAHPWADRSSKFMNPLKLVAAQMFML